MSGFLFESLVYVSRIVSAKRKQETVDGSSLCVLSFLAPPLCLSFRATGFFVDTKEGMRMLALSVRYERVRHRMIFFPGILP
jgi:hypothetical protein